MIARFPPALRRWQTWGWTLLALGIAYLAYLLISGLLTPEAPVAPSGDQMVMHGIESEGQNGNSAWHFIADSSEISADGYTTTYHNVHDATFNRDRRPLYRLSAATVTVDTRNQNYSANGGVHVWSTDARVPDDLRTEYAFWNQASQTLTCPTATTFLYHGTTMHTTHMTVDMRSGLSQLGDTSFEYFKPPASPTPIVSAAPLPPPSASPSPSTR